MGIGRSLGVGPNKGAHRASTKTLMHPVLLVLGRGLVVGWCPGDSPMVELANLKDVVEALRTRINAIRDSL
jgi:hypothetical protein